MRAFIPKEQEHFYINTSPLVKTDKIGFTYLVAVAAESFSKLDVCQHLMKFFIRKFPWPWRAWQSSYSNGFLKGSSRILTVPFRWSDDTSVSAFSSGPLASSRSMTGAESGHMKRWPFCAGHSYRRCRTSHWPHPGAGPVGRADRRWPPDPSRNRGPRRSGSSCRSVGRTWLCRSASPGDRWPRRWIPSSGSESSRGWVRCVAMPRKCQPDSSAADRSAWTAQSCRCGPMSWPQSIQGTPGSACRSVSWGNTKKQHGKESQEGRSQWQALSWKHILRHFVRKFRPGQNIFRCQNNCQHRSLSRSLRTLGGIIIICF